MIDFDKMKSSKGLSLEEAISIIDSLDTMGILISVEDYDVDIKTMLQNQELKIYVDNIDDEEKYKEIMEKGYTGIFTNNLYIRD